MSRFGYQARWRGQLDGSPQSSVNCGVIATGRAVDQATKGGRKPGPAPIRDRMDVPKGGTTMWDVDRAIDSYDSDSELPDPYVRLRGRRETDGGDGGQWRDVLAWLPDGRDRKRNGRSVVMGVHYGTLRRAAPRKTGSESFDGWHGITLTAVRGPEDDREVRMLDSLNDGRYPGCPGPGPVWIKASKIRDAAFRYGKAVHGQESRIAGVFVPPGIREQAPEPPEPVDPCEEANEAIVEALADLLEIVDEHPEWRPALDTVILELQAAAPRGNVGHADDTIEDGMDLRPIEDEEDSES